MENKYKAIRLLNYLQTLNILNYYLRLIKYDQFYIYFYIMVIEPL